MRTGLRFVAVTLVASLLVGALAPAVWAQQPVPPQPAQQPAMMQEQMKGGDDGTWNTVANIYNVAYVPGKAIMCTLGGASAFVLMAITFGSAYKGATSIMREGCGGSWLLTADDVRPSPQDEFFTNK